MIGGRFRPLARSRSLQFIPQQAQRYPEELVCVLEPSHTKGGLFIGNVEAAENLGNLHREGIGAVLTVAHDVDLSSAYSRYGIDNYIIPVEDHESSNLLSHLSSAISFIDHSRTRGNVLVHCVAGISRSSTVVLAYLVAQGMNLQQAYGMLVSRKRNINPNSGFMRQLEAFERGMQVQMWGWRGPRESGLGRSRFWHGPADL